MWKRTHGRATEQTLSVQRTLTFVILLRKPLICTLKCLSIFIFFKYDLEPLKKKPLLWERFAFRIINIIRDLLEGPLFYQFMGFVAFLAFALLFMDQSMSQIDIDTIYSINLITCQTSLNLIACYFGDNLSRDLLDVADVSYNIIWYQFALKERTFLPWIIRRSQIPFQLTGFKLIDCSMSTFMKVYILAFSAMRPFLRPKSSFFQSLLQLFRSAGSYYVIFRQAAEKN